MLRAKCCSGHLTISDVLKAWHGAGRQCPSASSCLPCQWPDAGAAAASGPLMPAPGSGQACSRLGPMIRGTVPRIRADRDTVPPAPPFSSAVLLARRGACAFEEIRQCAHVLCCTRGRTRQHALGLLRTRRLWQQTEAIVDLWSSTGAVMKADEIG